MVMGASLIDRASGAIHGRGWEPDSHDGEPPASVSVQEFEYALNGLLGWETTCWPWIDLVEFYIGAKVFAVRDNLKTIFEIAVPIRHTASGERVIVYRAGAAIDFRAFFKLCRLKDFNRLVAAIYRRERRGCKPSMYNDISQTTIRSSLDSTLFYSSHTGFRDNVHAGLSGANVGYWFEQVFPARPKGI